MSNNPDQTEEQQFANYLKVITGSIAASRRGNRHLLTSFVSDALDDAQLKIQSAIDALENGNEDW